MAFWGCYVILASAGSIGVIFSGNSAIWINMFIYFIQNWIIDKNNYYVCVSKVLHFCFKMNKCCFEDIEKM